MVAEHVEKLRARDKEFDKKLSPATYAWKQIRNIVGNIAGLAGGGVVGYSVGNAFWKDAALSPKAKFFVEILGASPTVVSKMSLKHVTAGIGAFCGWLVAITMMGYEHWANGEAARLSVDEINRDIAEAKLRMNPELKRENDSLREIVAEQDEQIQKLEHSPHNKISAELASRELLMHNARHDNKAIT